MILVLLKKSIGKAVQFGEVITYQKPRETGRILLIMVD